MKKGLFSWLRFYLYFEKIIMKKSLSFPQGLRLVEKYTPNNNKAIPWISTAIKDDDLVLNNVKESLLEKDKIILLNVGRLTRAKNQITLIESLNLIHNNGFKNVYLKIVGKKDKKILLELNNAISKYKLENFVEIVPPVNHGEELWRIFDSADIFVFSSIWEGTPKVLLEALARSLPIVSTNVGGIPSVIKDELNGLLCDKNNYNTFAKKIEKFISMDSASLNKFIDNGYKEVNKYTISAQRKILIDALYDNDII
jgi:glycosyltransferase involved in cell wall biosynthesis